MGTLSVERADRLLWLGRYVERSLTTLQFIITTYDAAIDSVEGNWKGQLEELGFDQDTGDPMEFFDECLFSRGLAASVFRAMSNACDNAIRMRDVIGTESCAYVQMALDQLGRAEDSDAPLLGLQSVIDMIMAFKGSCDDFIADDAARNIIKCGFSIERMDLCLRLGYHLDDVRKETQKLATRIDRTGIPYGREAFKSFVSEAYSPGFPKDATYESLGDMLSLLFEIFPGGVA